MTYSVKEMFYSLQGEGAHSGRPAVFCRFAGCNLWSGREADRAQAQCTFCDTDFVGTDGEGGGRFHSAAALATAVRALWPAAAAGARPYVICTGGEPLLQLDEALVDALHREGFEVAVETNGSLPAPRGLDWICVSPKGRASLQLTRGDELKLVYPQADCRPEQFVDMDFDYFYLQPMDNEQGMDNTRLVAQYCLAHPRWRMSLQTHKIIGLK